MSELSLVKMIAVNWSFHEQFDLPLTGTSAFIGDNGTGKSALLDMIQVTYAGGKPAGVRLNPGAQKSQKGGRTIGEYALGAVETRFLRDSAICYIALAFEGDKFESAKTIAFNPGDITRAFDMSGKTGIEWTSATWNPTIGCEIVSPGCKNCYAMRQARRLASNPVLKPNLYKGVTKATKGGPVWTGVVRMAPHKTVLKPLGWRKPSLIFVNSMSDVFHSSLKASEIAQTFAVMAIGNQHIYQVLTKRPDIMHAFVTDPATPASVELAMQAIRPGSRLPSWPLKNVWMGTSVEDQRRAGERVQALLQVPAAVRFLSMEPLIGEVLLEQEMTRRDWKRLHWIIVGGESGPKARPMHPEWARRIRDDCVRRGVRFFFKQVGSNSWVRDRKAKEFLTVAGRTLKQRENSTDQGVLRGSKKSGGRKLDGQLHEDMPPIFPSFKAFGKAI